MTHTVQKLLQFFLLLSLFVKTSVTYTQGNVEPLKIIHVDPGPNTIGAPLDTRLIVRLNQPIVDTNRVDNLTFNVFGSLLGLVPGSVALDSGKQVFTFTPVITFFPGEQVTAIFAGNFTIAGGVNQSLGYVWSFVLAATDGNGTFSSSRVIEMANKTKFVCATDLNKDHRIDLVAVTENSEGLSRIISLANQNDSYQSVWHSALSATVKPVYLPDLNGDGSPDILAILADENKLLLYLNNGLGEFGSNPRATFESPPNPRSAFISDLDADGDLDVVICGYSNSGNNNLWLYKNSGTGDLEVYARLNAGKKAQTVLGADWDAYLLNGTIDLAISAVRNILVFKNDGSGSMQESQVLDIEAFDDESGVAGDLNGDGHCDLIFSSITGFHSYINDATGIFSKGNFYPTGDWPKCTLAADIIHNNSPEIVTVNRESNDISIYKNNGSDLADQFKLMTFSRPRSIACADLNADGALDLVVAHENSDSMLIYFNEAKENRPPDPPILDSPANGNFSGSLAPKLSWLISSDLDGDSLHFIVRFSQLTPSASLPVIYSSEERPDLFEHLGNPQLHPPVAPASGFMRFQVPINLKNERYRWEVLAKDVRGVIGQPSQKWMFTVDNVAPVILALEFANQPFQSRWFKNDSTLTQVKARVRYTERHAKKIILDAGTVLGKYEKMNIPIGQQVAVDFNIPLPKTSLLADGQYPIQVTLQDSVPLSAAITSLLGLDGHYPVACTIKPLPETMTKPVFVVSWEPGDDGTGVGLSGKYDVFYREDSGAWQLWLDDTDSLSATFNRARDQHRYGFQALTWDLVNNREPLNSDDEAWTLVNVSKDTIPPAAPIDLKANDNAPKSPWKNTPNFSITWQNPIDPSQIRRALYKLGIEPPTHSHDVTDSSETLEKIEIRATKSEGQWLYVWLRDGAGNCDAKNYAAVYLRWDNTVPKINSMTFVNATFGENWYNPNVTQILDFVVNWTEAHAAKLSFAMTALRDSATIYAPIKQPSVFSIPIANTADGAYPIAVTVTDSAANKVSQVAQLRLDGTPPFNTRTISPSISTTLAFIVRWAGAGEDGDQGSGLAGVYDVWKSLDGTAWEFWLARNSDGQAVYGDEPDESTQHGELYYFKAGAYDNVGNHEMPGAAQCSTKVDTTYADNIAPPAPLSLKANGRSFVSPWSNMSRFNITWLNPPDPSGIDRIYYKLGTKAPKDSSDYTNFTDATAQQLKIDVKEMEYGVYLYVWLKDGNGNSNHANRDSILLRYDRTVPKIIKYNVSSFQAKDNEVFWFNPDSTHQAIIDIEFEELLPEQVAFTDSAQVYLVVTRFNPGAIHRVKFDYPLNKQDGQYRLQASVADSAGNQVSTLFTLGVDGQAPTGAVARTEPIVTKKAFTVFWRDKDKGDDGNGSGLSGEYQLKVRMDDGIWQEIPGRIRGQSYIFTGEDGHQYDFEVAAYDRVGNLETWRNFPETTTSVKIGGMDRQSPGPPRDLKASGSNPSPWQNSYKFLLSWEEPANDYHNLKKGFYTFASKPDTISFPILYPHSDTLTMFARKEGIDTLFIWLQDSSNNVNSDSAATVALRVDLHRPIIDSLKVINPDFSTNWLTQQKTRNAQIAVYFNEANPAMATGILSGPYAMRLTGQIDGTEQIALFEIPIQQPFIPDGRYWLKVGLIDAANNASLSDSAEFFLDGTRPVISHNTIALVTQGDSIVISAKIADNNRIDSALVFFKLSGARQYKKMPMFSINDSSFFATISATFTDSARSIDYYLLASDGLNFASLPADMVTKHPYSIEVYYVGANRQGLMKPGLLPIGSEQNGYRMMSIPLNLEDARAYAVLEDDLGKLDKSRWRFFKYFPLQSEYVEYPFTGNIEPGQAYWLITNLSNISLDTGPGTTIRSDRNFVIRLRKGWNDIGNPFNFDIAVENVLASIAGHSGVMGPYTYDGSWRIPVDIRVIKAWEGYSFYSDKDDYSLAIPPIMAVTGLQKGQNKNMLWQVALRVRCQNAADLSNYLGCAKGSSAGYDSLDYFEPPAMGAFVSLYFPHRDWQEYPGNYTTDFRAPGTDQEEWEFIIASNIYDVPVQVKAEVLQSPPDRFHLYLVDLEQNQTLDLMKAAQVVFSLNSRANTRRFKLIAANALLEPEDNPAADELPRTTRLVQNYPNPFNESTMIEYEVVEPGFVELKIYNLLAQKVRTLFEGHLEPGFYQDAWDGKDDRGDDLGAGIYLLRLETHKFHSIRKLIYVK